MSRSSIRPDRRTFLLGSAALLATALPACSRLEEDHKFNAELLVGEATATVKRFRNIPELKDFADEIPKARAIVVLPNVVKAGFFAGAEGGSGVLIARYPDRSWGQPVFYTLVSGSFGLQAGIQNTEVILVIRNDGALQAILDNQGKFGADAGVTLAVIGAGAEAATTTNLDADVLAFANAKLGLFGGFSLEGSALVRRQDFNGAVYGADVKPNTIVYDRSITTPVGEPLRRALAGT